MSFDIQGIGAPQGAARIGSTRAPAAPAADVQAADDAVEVRTMPTAPPQEVMDAISRAADAYDELLASGRRLQFESDPLSGRVSAHLADLDGNQLSPVTPSGVLAIADGAKKTS